MLDVGNRQGQLAGHNYLWISRRKADDQIRGCGSKVERVQARAAVHLICPQVGIGIEGKGVIPAAAVDDLHIRKRVTAQPGAGRRFASRRDRNRKINIGCAVIGSIVAAAAIQRVIARAADKAVVAIIAGEGIIPIAADQVFDSGDGQQQTPGNDGLLCSIGKINTDSCGGGR